MTGTVFDIKELTIHDGPGTRVTVFLKGCPLRCGWCHNPEGLSAAPQLMVKQAQCVHCGVCMQGCSHPDCAPFGRCLHACPKGLVSVSGTVWEAKELAAKLQKYKPFFADGGGVTFSGGEPLLQADFVIEVSRHLPGIHKTLQTSGYADSEVFRRVLNEMDHVLLDIKLAHPEEHKVYTGVSNEKILENYKILLASGKPHAVRIPLIPGITDREENLRGIAKIAEHSPVELMRYNALAGAKYPMVGLEYALPERPAAEVDLSWFKNAKYV